MLFIRGLHNLKEQKEKSIITIGNFDGVHLGHQAIIQQMMLQAQAEQLSTTVVIFEPQPKEYFMGENAPRRITPLREKIKILKKLGVDKVLCLYFDVDLAMLSPENFIEKIIAHKLQAKYVWVGEDFRFGHKQRGDVRLLEKLGEVYSFQVKLTPTVEIPPPLVGRGAEGGGGVPYTKKISSTLIRTLLQQGQIEQANNLLGRPFSLSGRVMRGDGRGHKIGFPTANIRLPSSSSALSSGVYAVKVSELSLHAVANLGTRPTFHGVNTVLEVHLLHFSGDLYNRYLSIEFMHKLRDEQRFESVDALKAQIARDITQAKRYFEIAT